MENKIGTLEETHRSHSEIGLESPPHPRRTPHRDPYYEADPRRTPNPDPYLEAEPMRAHHHDPVLEVHPRRPNQDFMDQEEKT